MRDDVRQCLDSLLQLIIKKNSLLKKILLTEQRTGHYLKIKTEFDIEKSVQIIDETINTINTVDFDIAEMKASFSKITGIGNHQFNNFLKNTESDITKIILAQMSSQNKLLNEIIQIKESNNLALKTILKKTELEIDDIQRTDKIKNELFD